MIVSVVRFGVVVMSLLLVARVSAHPAPLPPQPSCSTCADGDSMLDAFGDEGAVLRQAYTHPSSAGSGPVLDVGVGLGTQASDGAVWLRVHGRFGLTPEISELRAVFLSLGLEFRIDRRRWRDGD